MAIDPTGADLKRFLEEDDGCPVVMLNLLRFKPVGRKTYAKYLASTQEFLAGVGGEVVHLGEGGRALVAEDGQAWDAVLLVRYPSRQAFSQMVANPDYQKVTHLRAEALEEAVLQPTSGWGGAPL